MQCSDFGASDFAAGDFVTMHTARTNSWGVTDGVDVTDGYTAVFEVYEVDAVNNRLVFRTPVMTDYAQQFPYTSLGGQAAAARPSPSSPRACTSSRRTSSAHAAACASPCAEPVRIYNPPAVDDFESTTRVSWDMTAR